MTGSFPAAVRGRWRPGARFLFRVGRRTLVESLYLLTAPVTAAAGLLLVLGGLCAGTAGLLLPTATFALRYTSSEPLRPLLYAGSTQSHIARS